ncbi:hypothetical protein BpHYR1_009876, partial [Brachionus plicatilis]
TCGHELRQYVIFSCLQLGILNKDAHLAGLLPQINADMDTSLIDLYLKWKLVQSYIIMILKKLEYETIRIYQTEMPIYLP